MEALQLLLHLIYSSEWNSLTTLVELDNRELQLLLEALTTFLQIQLAYSLDILEVALNAGWDFVRKFKEWQAGSGVGFRRDG